MENASKALLIAGEILIALLILSLAVYLITSYSGTEESYQERMTAQQIEAYNTKFTQYIEYGADGNMYISAQNLITIGNLASSIANQNEGTAITTVSFDSNVINGKIEGKLKNDTSSMFQASAYNQTSYPIYYSIQITNYDSMGRIHTITVPRTKHYKSENSFNEI